MKKKKHTPSRQVKGSLPSTQWYTHPWREQPWRGSFAFLVGMFFCAEVYLMGAGLLLSLVCALVFLYSLAGFFLPTCYQIQKREFTIKAPFKKQQTFTWEMFKSFYEKRNRIYLFREPQPPVLVTSRAVALAFPPGGEIQAQVRQHLHKKKVKALHPDKT